MPLNPLDRLVINGYTSNSFSGAHEKFSAPINPEKLNMSRSVTLSNGSGSTPARESQQFQSRDSDKLDFSLVFDGTGIIPYAGFDVAQDLEDLEKVVFDMDSDAHRPRYLEVLWGSLNFRGQIQSYSVDCSLFKQDGTPLRAKVQLSLVSYTDPETAARESNTHSPDMTRVLTVREGDTLPIMCMQAYDDFSYYLQVAEINGLDNFRELEVGQQIVFPPLKK
ncbi:MAG: hypothetical protein AAFV07_19010 [Bacteroidota bacterium]